MNRFINSENGSILLLVTILVFVIACMGAAFLVHSSTNVKVTGNKTKYKIAKEIASSTCTRIFSKLKDTCENINSVNLSQEQLDEIAKDFSEHESNSEIDVKFVVLDKDQPSAMSVPQSDYFPANCASLNSVRRRFRFDVTVRNNEISAKARASISFYEIPLFQWLRLADEALYFAPGTDMLIKGRIHSNTAIMAGGFGEVTFSPNDIATSSDLAVTSSGKIYHLFKINQGGSIYSYIGADNYVEIDSGHFLNMNDYLLGNEFMDISGCSADQGESNHCWTTFDPLKNITLYGMEIDSSSDDFNNRVASDAPPILPGWAERLDNPVELIEPGYSTDDSDQKALKKWYQANLRVITGNDGVPKSVDENGTEIDCSSSLCYTNLESLGIIQRSENDFYMPVAGRNADVTYLDIEQLKIAMESDSELAKLKHIYIGGTSPPRGEVHFPSVDCDPEEANTGYSPICMDGDENDCTSSCVATNTGRFEAVIIKNGSEIPSNGIQVTSPNSTWLQGDFNTVNESFAQINSDSLGFLSNSWESESKIGWDPINPTGKRNATETSYSFAALTGFEMPLLENWRDNDLNRKMSFITLWSPKEFPPKAGNYEFSDWWKLAWKFFYGPATWKNSQFVQNPPDNSDIDIFALGSSITFDEDLIGE